MSRCLESLLDAERRAQCAASDEKPQQPADMRLCLNPHWQYTPANDTDVTRTWRRHGWIPVMAFRSPR